MHKLFVTFLFFLVIHTVSALKIEGIVKDARTGEFLPGAHVFLMGTDKSGTTAGLNGSFVINGIEPGNYKLKCTFISYQTFEKEIIVL